jgi:hypothetical protein
MSRKEFPRAGKPQPRSLPLRTKAIGYRWPIRGGSSDERLEARQAWATLGFPNISLTFCQSSKLKTGSLREPLVLCQVTGGIFPARAGAATLRALQKEDACPSNRPANRYSGFGQLRWLPLQTPLGGTTDGRTARRAQQATQRSLRAGSIWNQQQQIGGDVWLEGYDHGN